MAKTVAKLGVFIALAFIFSYIEAMIPFSFGIPGIKLGLANLVVVAALYLLNGKSAFGISVLRIVLVGFTFGSLSSILYSFSGGIISFGVMALTKKSGRFGVMGVSVLGAVAHNMGQIITAVFVLQTTGLFYYFPVLLLSGVVTGILIGGIADVIIKRISRMDQF